jgi:hypothetical protein
LLNILEKALDSSLNRRNTYTKGKSQTAENTAMVNTSLSGGFQTIQRKSQDALVLGSTISLWVELFKIKKAKDSLDRLRLSRVKATWKPKAIEIKPSSRWLLW